MLGREELDIGKFISLMSIMGILCLVEFQRFLVIGQIEEAGFFVLDSGIGVGREGLGGGVFGQWGCFCCLL